MKKWGKKKSIKKETVFLCIPRSSFHDLLPTKPSSENEEKNLEERQVRELSGILRPPRPAKYLKILVPQSPSIDVSELDKICQLTDFVALKV